MNSENFFFLGIESETKYALSATKIPLENVEFPFRGKYITWIVKTFIFLF